MADKNGLKKKGRNNFIFFRKRGGLNDEVSAY
jgi:hypothetical protein